MDGAWVLVSRRAYAWPRTPARFDIVKLEEPGHPGHFVIKRIVGLPDEDVRFENGSLLIDDEPLPDVMSTGSLAGPPPTRWTSGLTPGGGGASFRWAPCTNEYVVLGDNRSASTDSRRFGTVPAGAIRGKIIRRLR